MKARLLPAILILGITILSLTTIEDIKKEKILKSYPEFIHVKISTSSYSGDSYIEMSVDSIRKSHFLRSFVNENKRIINYLFKNYSKIINDESIEYLKSDSVKLKAYFYNSLEKDSIFNSQIIQLAYNHLKRDGIIISDFMPLNKIEISTDSILSIATRFFYLYDIKNKVPRFKSCIDGCTRDEDIAMPPIIEAFCWHVIRSDDNVYYDYQAARKKIRELKVLYVSQTKKEEFYRNAMYAEMKKSIHLKNAIKIEYKKKKDILNFVMIDN